MTEPRDPFDALVEPHVPVRPDEEFVRTLRGRLVVALEPDADPLRVPTIEIRERNPMAATTTHTATPYLAVRGGVDALAWYVDALGAVELMRVVGDDGRLGHAELTFGGARVMLSDGYPEHGVHSPADLGGTAVTVHLEVVDVDTSFERAVDRGATAVSPPEDQPHGSRHGTLVDPFGHRWMLSQRIEQVDAATDAGRVADDGFEVTSSADGEPAGDGSGSGPGGGEPGIWAGLSYRDADAGLRFLVERLGFEVQSLHHDPDRPDVVVHGELRWPEGGVVQVGTYVEDNPFMQAPGAQSIYVITARPAEVWERCVAASATVERAPEEPGYHPGGMVFAIRDPEGNILSFGDYAGGA